MATRIENTAAAPATSQPCGNDPYSFENMLYYQESLSLLRGMVRSGVLDQKRLRQGLQDPCPQVRFSGEKYSGRSGIIDLLFSETRVLIASV